MNKCPKCGTEFEGNFCPECGTKWQEDKICPQCGASSKSFVKFCNHIRRGTQVISRRTLCL